MRTLDIPWISQRAAVWVFSQRQALGKRWALDQREMNALAASEDIAQIIVEAGEEMKEKYLGGLGRLPRS